MIKRKCGKRKKREKKEYAIPGLKKMSLSETAKSTLGLWSPTKCKINLRSYVVERRGFVLDGAGKKKGLIGKSSTDRWRVRWIYYPLPEHFPIMEEAHRNLAGGGPHECFPGSVGVISILKVGREGITARKAVGAKEVWLVVYIKANFRIGKGEELKHPQTLNRSIATRYGGWRNRLLGQIFKEATKANAAVSFSLTHPTTQLEIFRELAEKSGFRVAKEGRFLIAYKE
jgi:hypothetical protein